MQAPTKQAPAKQVMTLTDAAAGRLKELMAKRDDSAIGLRIGVRTGGCSGMAYSMEFAAEKGEMDEVVEDKGVTVLIDPKATLFLIGTEMDFVQQSLQSGFVFNNPNEKGRCGCGESFYV
jgi:iron-sulfur cluster assembly protein